MNDHPQLHAMMLWEDLKLLTKNVVEGMNRVDELRNRTGGLEFQFGKDNGIVINSQSAPVLSVSVSLLPAAIEIHNVTVIQGQHPLERQSPEILDMDMDQRGQPVFRTEQGEAWTAEQTVYHFLRPFLHLGSASH